MIVRGRRMLVEVFRVWCGLGWNGVEWNGQMDGEICW